MSDPTPAADTGAQKRSHDEIADPAASHATQDPAPKRQNTGPAPSAALDPLASSAADAVISSSTNVLTAASAPDAARSLPPMDEEEMMAMLSAQESGLDAARSGPSLLPSHAEKKQQRQKQRGRVKYEKSAERYKGKDSREWGSRNEEGKEAAGVDGDERAPRLPKYKCAILLGFSGSGYNGMQMYVPILTPPNPILSFIKRSRSHRLLPAKTPLPPPPMRRRRQHAPSRGSSSKRSSTSAPSRPSTPTIRKKSTSHARRGRTRASAPPETCTRLPPLTCFPHLRGNH